MRFLLAPIVVLSTFLTAAPAAAENVDFDRDIQPIFAAHCLKCHGNAENKGGLRLSTLAAATAALESGLTAIHSGNADESPLIRRVSSQDPNERMPPEGAPLTGEQIDRLRRWINSGAPWPEHWAYRPLNAPQPPRNEHHGFAEWPRTPIDQFIVKQLIERRLEPAPPADKRTLLRRVYFDLIGLPPTPDQVRVFEADSRHDAFARVVDELLDDPRYGERWARHWMDVVHFAETHGHDQDRPRENAWPYRDYLIQSFNADKSYARFVQEQVAGDILYAEDPAAIVATGFLATGPWDESSLRDIREDTLDREIARYLDRDDVVATVMSTFASSTVHCARCHDHKFDPITQRDYYGLQAVFSATDKANRPFDLDPHVGAKRRAIAAELAALPGRRKQNDPSLLKPETLAEAARWESQLKTQLTEWKFPEILEAKAANSTQFKPLDDGSLLATGTRPEKDTYTLTIRPTQQYITSLRIEVLTDSTLPKTGPGRQENGNLHLNELRVFASGSSGAIEAVPLKLHSPRADFNQEGWSIDKALDGNSATAWGIFPEVGKPHVAVVSFEEPLTGDRAATLRIELEQSHGGGHLIGRFRISTTHVRGPVPAQRETVPMELAALLRIPATERCPEQQMDLSVAWLREKYGAKLGALPAQQLVYCGTNQYQADGSFRPSAGPRPVHVLERGEITKPLDLAVPGALGCLPGLPGRLELKSPNDEGFRRAALAQWLTHPENSLTWRSMANRVWHYHFGRGIVDSPNDFGKMGGTPSHPELLDWLADQLRSNGGSIKHLHRLILSSAVYQQSSRHDERFAEIDADNVSLWRMNRRRLDAESIRDSVLYVAGTLDATMGGPSVRQFIQTPGVHVTPVVDYVNFDVNNPANCRRSVYRFIFRTLPDPSMDTLDCPDASQLTPRRNSSLTALQALAMLHDKTLVRHCQHLSDRLSRSNTPLDAQINEAFWLILGRPPSSREAARVGEYAGKHGLANTCRFLFNSNEFMFVE